MQSISAISPDRSRRHRTTYLINNVRNKWTLCCRLWQQMLQIYPNRWKTPPLMRNYDRYGPKWMLTPSECSEYEILQISPVVSSYATQL